MTTVFYNIMTTMNKLNIFTIVIVAAAMTMSCASCRSTKKSGQALDTDTVALLGPVFNADSAYAYTQAQCDFGPRTMNSQAHDRCGRWIAGKFRSFGYEVEEQRCDLRGYDGTVLKSTNIMARYNPSAKERVLLCAHWDTRPWADNDPDSANWRKPVMGADDGASGVAVMLELARILRSDSTLSIGVDFVCFDAEDWGTPEWERRSDSGDTWALGAHYWATHLPHDYEVRYGILFDMVGGQGAAFHQEGVSRYYAPNVVDKVWGIAHSIGYSSRFPMSEGGSVTDDHVPLNEIAGIPTIDIIPYYADCPQSSFGPTWHTVNDDMQHIDRTTLKAVGQVVVQTLYSEQ